MATVTKRRDEKGWRVVINGQPTDLLIEKGAAPRYRQPQMYDVVLDSADSWLFEAKGVGNAIAVIERILEAAG